MARKRLLVETSDNLKAALLEAVDSQDLTLADWLEEQVSNAVPHSRRQVREDEIEPFASVNTATPKQLFSTLAKRDWSFRDDDTRYLTHDLHPYPAKFIPQIPAELVKCLSARGDLIFDPFGGSGTTAVESVRLGRRAVSMDANPLSSLMGRVKTGYMTPAVRADLEQLLASLEGHLLGVRVDASNWVDGLNQRHSEHIPNIPNLPKWFSRAVTGELALLRFLIEQTTHGLARDAADLALSRIVLRVSYQDSETRYVAVPKNIPPGFALRGFIETLKRMMKRLELAAGDIQFADAHFVVGDSRTGISEYVGDDSVDLVVTSPPYPNATDYHLYHRFRMYWLGFDPKALGDVEIGSHLKHQREGSGFTAYREDMSKVIAGTAKVLRPGRYAVFVVGDAQFQGKVFSTGTAIAELAQDCGLQFLGSIQRQVHATKRSFAPPARRARVEELVVLFKPDRPVATWLHPPTYKMWEYEGVLRCKEIEALTGISVKTEAAASPVKLNLRQAQLWNIRRLTFTAAYTVGRDTSCRQDTWQKVLENGDSESKTRKDPKYVTHGIHPYKGKFYPQLAKVLLNLSGTQPGSRILDPFCGSGTLLLEGMLNGFESFGCDLNPLAAKIARAKTGILCLPREVVDLALKSLRERIARHEGVVRGSRQQFPAPTHEELARWFPSPVLDQVDWILTHIRLLGNKMLVDFLEVLLSSVIREVSHQDPSDLRVRRRKDLLLNAPVLELFSGRLATQLNRLHSYWQIAGRQPSPLIAAKVGEGDSRDFMTLSALGLGEESVDAVITSPPYATALPYIDTDRLSLLAIMGMPSRLRSNIEDRITGSREISKSERDELESTLHGKGALDDLPKDVVVSLRRIHARNAAADVGFRRANMSALLFRYFNDMKHNLLAVRRVLRSGGSATYVIGDSRTQAGAEWTAIPTTAHIAAIGEQVGLVITDRTPIDVTTEAYKHIRNAITSNEIVRFIKR